MTRREDFLVGKIDRTRERQESKDARAARQAALQERASALLLCEIANLPANDHADFSECLAVATRLQLVRLHGEQTAAVILSREAGVAGRNLLPRKIAAAEAERLFAKVANDRGEG